jgi:hypothetical protein
MQPDFARSVQYLSLRATVDAVDEGHQTLRGWSLQDTAVRRSKRVPQQ